MKVITIINLGPQLRTVCTMSVGYEHVDIEECKKRNLPIGFTPDVLTNATAELTMSLLLATSRRLNEGRYILSHTFSSPCHRPCGYFAITWCPSSVMSVVFFSNIFHISLLLQNCSTNWNRTLYMLIHGKTIFRFVQMKLIHF